MPIAAGVQAYKSGDPCVQHSTTYIVEHAQVACDPFKNPLQGALGRQYNVYTSNMQVVAHLEEGCPA